MCSRAEYMGCAHEKLDKTPIVTTKKYPNKYKFPYILYYIHIVLIYEVFFFLV